MRIYTRRYDLDKILIVKICICSIRPLEIDGKRRVLSCPNAKQAAYERLI